MISGSLSGSYFYDTTQAKCRPKLLSQKTTYIKIMKYSAIAIMAAVAMAALAIGLY
jgi:hypothetical protein